VAGFEGISRKMHRPIVWSVVFYVYCCSSFVFWPTSAVVASVRGHVAWWAALLGVPLVLVYALLLKISAQRLNNYVGVKPMAAQALEAGQGAGGGGGGGGGGDG
jgi:membrane associated rhomboid family serine protease